MKQCLLKAAVLLTLSGTAFAENLSVGTVLTCTTSERFYCAENEGCKVNIDATPSVYKLTVKTANKVQIQKQIDGKNTSVWDAVRGSNESELHFIEMKLPSLFAITNDRTRFTYQYNSGIALFNSNKALKRSNDTNHLGGQIEVGSCTASEIK